MHYIDIDWVPSAIAIALAMLIVASLRLVVWLGKRRAPARTARAIERALSDWDREEAGSKGA
jgi:hypothetical protein